MIVKIVRFSISLLTRPIPTKIAMMTPKTLMLASQMS